MTGAVSALADVAPVADVDRIASAVHAVADSTRRCLNRNTMGLLLASRLSSSHTSYLHGLAVAYKRFRPTIIISELSPCAAGRGFPLLSRPP
jgi:hypothetical protein